MQKVLVTGAFGFIGRQVVKVLLENNYQVVGVSSRECTEYNYSNFEKVTLDLLDYNAVKEFFNENHFENLIHLAWYNDKKCHIHNLNIEWVSASLNILKCFQQSGGKKVLMNGSISEYDFDYGYFREDLTPLKNKSLFGKSKTALFEVAQEFCSLNNIDFKWARVFNLYGQYERPERLMPSVINSMLKGEDVKVSTCTKFQDYSHVEDVASAIVKLFESDIKGALNICSGKPVQLKTIVEKIKEITNFKGNILYGAIPSSFEHPIVVGDNTKLIQELGFIPKYSLEEGLEKCVDWWRKQNNG